MNTNKNNGLVITQKVQTFTLLKRPEIAPRGMPPGTINDLVMIEGTKNEKPFREMDITVLLDAKNTKGEPFRLTRKYNLGENGRGFAMFLGDYNRLMGTSLVKRDLIDLDPGTLRGKRVLAEVDYTGQGADVSSVLKGLHPYPENETALSTAQETAAA